MKKACRLFLAILLFHPFSSHAASRYWVGTGLFGTNWTTTLNWSGSSGGIGGSSVPGAGDDVIFDGGPLLHLDVGNCTINATVSVASLTISSFYTGTISQGANPITVAGAASFGGGTFTGGTVAITITGVFTLSATTFTSTSGILQLQNNAAFTGGSFAHNNGEVQFDAAGAATVSGTSPTFYTLEFDGNGNTYTISTGAVPVVNALNIAGAGSLQLNTGVINLTGNLNLTNTATTDGGTATINFTGGAAQAIVSALPINESTLPSVSINKTGVTTLTMPAWLTVSGNWTYTSGTVDVTTNSSTVVFDNTLTITGNLTLNNVTFEGNNSHTITVSTGTILTVTGTLATTGGFNVFINTPVTGATAIQAQGNISIGNTSVSGGGTGLILINGTGAQLFSSSSPASEGLLPNITIQKASGTLTLSGIISVTRNWTYTSGTVDATTDASTVVFGGNNLNITSAGMSFYNVMTTANTSTLTNNMTVNNNLTIGGLSVLAPGANTINIAGNWSAWGSTGFSSATGTVNFNGSALQTITSPGGASFTNLIINNSSTGVQLENNATVTTTLTMTQGNIDLNGGNVLTLGLSVANNGTLVYSAGAIINAGTFTRWLKAVTIAGGSVNGLFPMGTLANNRLFYVSAPLTAPTTGGTISVAYNDVAGRTAVSFADGASTVAVEDNLNWAVTTGGLVGGTYNLDIQGTGYGVIGTITDLRLVLAGSAIGVAGVNAGTTTNPQVNTTGLSLANLSNSFFMGSVNAITSPLPVELVSFTATVVNAQVRLAWETATETDNDYFTVERSKDGVLWDSLERVAGSGTAAGASFYTADDPAPYTGVSFYRLVQTDFGGKQTYSTVDAVNVQSLASNISIYPNPAANHTTVSFSVAGHYIITLFNSTGQPVLSPVSSSGEPVSLAVSSLPAGVYFIRIKSAGQIETRAVVIGKVF